MDVDETVDARLPEEPAGFAVGWWSSRKRTLVPVRKQLIWALVGGYVSICLRYLQESFSKNSDEHSGMVILVLHVGIEPLILFDNIN